MALQDVKPCHLVNRYHCFEVCDTFIFMVQGGYIWFFQNVGIVCMISGFCRGINEIFLFCNVKQHRLVVSYLCFGTTYWSHLQGKAVQEE